MNHSLFIDTPNLPIIQKSLKDKNSFKEKFAHFVNTQDINGLICFLQTYATKYPFSRDFIRQSYNTLLTEGLPEAANECARIYVETYSKVSKIAQNSFGLPLIFNFLSDDEKRTELINQAAYTKVLLELGYLKTKPVFPLTERNNNEFTTAFSPYLEECFELISNRTEVTKFFSDITALSPYEPYFYKFPEKKCGRNANFFIDCHANLNTNYISRPLLEIKDATTEKAKKFLTLKGISPKDDFAVIYLRNPIYFDESTGLYKKSDFLNTFTEAIEYFLQQGLKVIRLGHPGTTPIFQRSGYIDLTQVEKPLEADIFLCAKAKFYFGSNSWLQALAQNFGVTCFETARINYTGTRANNFTQYQIFKNRRTGEKIMFSDIIKFGLKEATSLKPFYSKELVPCFTTSSNNLKFSKEALEYLEKGTIFQINESYAKLRENFHVWGALSSCSLAFLG